EEFARGLELAFPGAVSTREGGLTIDTVDARLEIEIEVLPALAIGLLRLPRLRARFAFKRGTPDACARLFDHLDRATQRGGG
ncbi:MAG TPA: hypothetical protein VFR86_11480, partial [Burkholderiaceae bacterium]|nr:hypothetical protein [Burkholderiaceae bacterium]